MKKILFYGVLLILSACDDGDLQIETLDFDSVSIENCNAVTIDVSNLLFKINNSEAIILELPAGSIKNEVTEEALTFSVSTSGPAKISYRTFSDDVTKNYFCSDIPLTSPTVVEEILAQGGNLIVSTTLNADGITYEHEIILSGISLVSSDGKRITDLRINNFGTVTTVAEVAE